MAQFVWVGRGEGLWGQEAIDLHGCTRQVLSESDHTLGYMYSAIYKTPDGRWVYEEEVPILLDPLIDPSEMDARDFLIRLADKFRYEIRYMVVSQETAASLLLGDGPDRRSRGLPPELETYRSLITDQSAFLDHIAEGRNRAQPAIPRWDSAARTITYAGRVCHVLARRAPVQEKALDVLEKKGWPERVRVDGVEPSQLKDAVAAFNDKAGINAWPISLAAYGRSVGWRPSANRSDLR